MFESLTFSQPILWWGALACVLPFIIHWMMRPRPQKVVFPATFLLQKVLAEGQSAQRIRNLWLLIVRALGLVVIAALLAGPTCRLGSDVLRDDRPVAAVLVCDDSWSALYQVSEQETVLDRLREVGLELVREAQSWPAGSVLGFVTTSGQGQAIPPTTQWERVEDQLQQLRNPAPNANTLRAALEDAGEWLRAVSAPRRRLILLSDLSQHALRDVAPDALAAVENLRVEAYPVLQQDRTNLALLHVAGPTGLLPVSAPVVLEATVRAEGAAARATLVVQQDDRVLLRSETLELPADRAMTTRLTLPRFSRGTHALEVRLEPDDRLPFDQVRYVAFEVGPPPEVWLLEPAAAEARTLTEHLLQNLLAPSGLPPQLHRVRLQRIAPDQIPTATQPPALVLVPSGQTLSDTARRRLLDVVERGARMLLLPTGRGRADWPGLRRYLAARSESETFDSERGWAWASGTETPTRLRGAWDATSVAQRVTLMEADEATVVEAVYGDGSTALLRRAYGRGMLYLLTTSPDPAWSNLGTQPVGLLRWLLWLCQQGDPSELHVATEQAGGVLGPRVAGLPSAGTVRIEGAGLETVQRVRLDDAPTLPTETPGVLVLKGPDEAVRRIALNWPPEESQLALLGEEGLQGALGTDEVVFVGQVDTGADWQWGVLLARPAEWFAFGLLVLLGLELVLSEWRKVS